MVVNKILFAVDNSDYAKKAVGFIEMMAKGNPSLEVVALHVLEPINILIGGEARENLKKDMQAAGQKVLDPFVAELNKLGVKVSPRMEQGAIGDQILNVLKNENCDMVVMGARGQSSIEELLLGSVSQRVLQFSKVPVLLSR